MESTSLHALADDHLSRAAAASSGRSAHTVYGGHEHALRQTLVALAAGRALDDHQSPGEATLQVVRGRVTVSAGGGTWEGTAGDFLVIPPDRHDLQAVEDSVVLLTVALAR